MVAKIDANTADEVKSKQHDDYTGPREQPRQRCEQGQAVDNSEHSRYSPVDLTADNTLRQRQWITLSIGLVGHVLGRIVRHVVS